MDGNGLNRDETPFYRDKMRLKGSSRTPDFVKTPRPNLNALWTRGKRSNRF